MTKASIIGILYLWPRGRKQGKGTYVYSLNASEDVAALASREAVLAGENARLKIELEEGDFEVVRDSMRRRLARTLVQLGMRIDPLVGQERSEEA
jgi:hypothetical protein